MNSSPTTSWPTGRRPSRRGDEERFPAILEALEERHHIKDIRRILWTR